MKPNRPVMLALALGFSLMVGAVALSQTPLDDDPLDDRSARRIERMEKVVRELRAIVFQGRETGQPIVVQPAETEQRIGELADRVTSLESSLTRLNGQLESANHTADEQRRLADQMNQQNAALSARIDALENKVATLSAPPPEAPPQQAAMAEDPEVLFGTARKQLLDGDYPGAEASFRAFVDQYGDSARAAEARYYLGKTLLARRAYAEAASADIAAIRDWPQTAWAPDAVLDLSRALVGMRRLPDACSTLTELGRRYPRATTDVKNRAATLHTQAQCTAP